MSEPLSARMREAADPTTADLVLPPSRVQVRVWADEAAALESDLASARREAEAAGVEAAGLRVGLKRAAVEIGSPAFVVTAADTGEVARSDVLARRRIRRALEAPPSRYTAIAEARRSVCEAAASWLEAPARRRSESDLVEAMEDLAEAEREGSRP